MVTCSEKQRKSNLLMLSDLYTHAHGEHPLLAKQIRLRTNERAANGPEYRPSFVLIWARLWTVDCEHCEFSDADFDHF